MPAFISYPEEFYNYVMMWRGSKHSFEICLDILIKLENLSDEEKRSISTANSNYHLFMGKLQESTVEEFNNRLYTEYQNIINLFENEKINTDSLMSIGHLIEINKTYIAALREIE